MGAAGECCGPFFCLLHYTLFLPIFLTYSFSKVYIMSYTFFPLFLTYSCMSPVLLVTVQKQNRGKGSKIWVRARNWPPRTLQTQKHRQIRRLRDPNPMEDVPDQDSANIPERKIRAYFAYPSKTGLKSGQGSYLHLDWTLWTTLVWNPIGYFSIAEVNHSGAPCTL